MATSQAPTPYAITHPIVLRSRIFEWNVAIVRDQRFCIYGIVMPRTDCALTSLPNLTFLIEAVYRYLFGLGPAHAQPASVAASSSVSQHGYRRYLCLSVDGQSNEITYLPVNQLHLRAHSLVAKFEQGGGSNHIDEAIILDREALELCPPGHPQRAVSVAWLAIHLSDRFDQLGARRDLEEAIVFDREAL